MPSGDQVEVIARNVMAPSVAAVNSQVNALSACAGCIGISAHSSRQSVCTPVRTSAPAIDEALAKIQRRRELGDGLLPCADLGRLRRSRQPARQRLFAGAGARYGEQLEERPAPEQVEIVRIHVTIVTEAVAGLAGSHPAILQTCEAALVERHRSGGAVARPQHAIVPAHEPREQHDRHGQPPEAER